MGERIYKPELAESKDEKIRKQLVEIVKRLGDGIIEIPENIADIFAWLEKQKEQKPEKLNDDTVVGLDRALQIIKDAKGSLCGYQSDDGIYECEHAIQTLNRILKNGIEQKPAEWSDTDELVFKDICKHLKEEGYNGWIVLLNALRNGESRPK